MNKTCEGCNFGAAIYEDEMFDQDTVEGFLLCHRYPPRPYTISKDQKVRQVMWGWPLVGKKEWCGEYQRKTTKRKTAKSKK